MHRSSLLPIKRKKQKNKKNPRRSMRFPTAPGLGVSSTGTAAARIPGRRLLPPERTGEGEEKGKVGKKNKKIIKKKKNQGVVKKCIRSKFGKKSMACN